MEKLINSDGSVRFGVFDDPVERINSMDHCRFSGRLITCDGEVVELKAVPGWTEDHFARW